MTCKSIITIFLSFHKKNKTIQIYGGSYCVDLYQYIIDGTKRYENSKILNLELTPKFSYYDLDNLKKMSPEKILQKDDRDEIYQIYHKTYKQTEKNISIADFYIWLKKNKCYLLELYVGKISRLLGKQNPFTNDMYSLDSAAFLYNRNFIAVYPSYGSIDVDPKREIIRKNKNDYRITRK